MVQIHALNRFDRTVPVVPYRPERTALIEGREVFKPLFGQPSKTLVSKSTGEGEAGTPEGAQVSEE